MKYKRLRARLKELKKENIDLKYKIDSKNGTISYLRTEIDKYDNGDTIKALKKQAREYLHDWTNEHEKVEELKKQLMEKDIEIQALNNVLCRKTNDYVETKKELLILQKERELENASG